LPLSHVVLVLLRTTTAATEGVNRDLCIVELLSQLTRHELLVNELLFQYKELLTELLQCCRCATGRGQDGMHLSTWQYQSVEKRKKTSMQQVKSYVQLNCPANVMTSGTDVGLHGRQITRNKKDKWEVVGHEGTQFLAIL
jgi:hypothetical protein